MGICYWVLAIGYGIASLYLIKLIEFIPSSFIIRYSMFVILFFPIPPSEFNALRPMPYALCPLPSALCSMPIAPCSMLSALCPLSPVV